MVGLRAFFLKLSAKLSIVFCRFLPYSFPIMKKETEIEKRIVADITIVGGGLAGVCAAIAAAREGCTVSLVHARSVLGGNSSSEIRVWTRGATGGGNLFAEEMGILGELKLANQYRNSEGNPILWDDILLDAVLAEPNISLFANTFAFQVETRDGHVAAVHALETNSERTFCFSSDYFVDATGDGFIAASAGMPFVIGKESRETYHEEKAPETFDPTTQGCTILMNTIKRDHPVPFVAPSFAYSLSQIEQLLNNGGRIVSEKSNGCDFWWVEFGGQLDTINDIASISLELKKLSYGIYNYIKNSGKYDAANLDLTWMGNLPGKRESRRFLTDYVLTGNDILDGTVFEDVAFYGGWYMDFHPSEGIYSKSDFCTQIPVPLYGIPLRVLYASSHDNLLLCGRILGASHTAFSSTRIMDTCALSGQAAGTAASVLVSRKLKTCNLGEPSVYGKVQAILDANDMLLPGYSPKPIGNIATCIASSVVSPHEGKERGKLELDRDFFLAIPVALANDSSLFIEAKVNTTLSVESSFSMLPSRNSQFGKTDPGMLLLDAGRNAVSLKPFCKGEGYLLLVIRKNPQVAVITSDRELPGILCGYTQLAAYHFPLLEIASLDAYGASNLTNGYVRPYGGANIWLSAQEENPSVKLVLDSEQTVSALEFFFDCSLSQEMVSSRVLDVDAHHNIYLRSGVSPALVRDFEIYAVVNEGNVLVERVHDNFQRHVKVSFDPVVTQCVFIRFLRTFGAKNTGVYEIRVY